jgi:3-oxoisoapionate kinase
VDLRTHGINKAPIRGTLTIDLLLSYYGDDFTGSTDALEALCSGGIETVLFVEPPTDEMMRRYPHVRAYGVAGNSRTMSPQTMDAELPDVFRALTSHQPRLVHYKTCSTFDSSPEVGSIGRAIDIGQRIFENQIIPLVVGVPPLGRYCVFGNLFARSGLGSDPFRLDRHPTMRNHPVTPMQEADLREHLALQTTRTIELLDVLALEAGYDVTRTKVDRVATRGSAVLFDALTDDHLETIGEVICDLQQAEKKPQFVVGSSGIDYALVKHWQATNQVRAGIPEGFRSANGAIAPADHVIILSGSCSPVTNRQIGWAIEHGFADVPIEMPGLTAKHVGTVVASASERILAAIDRGQPVVAYTSRGSKDVCRTDPKTSLEQAGEDNPDLGAVLGQIVLEVARVRSVNRVAVVGGDTAGQFARETKIEAVEMMGPLEPGAPLCVVRSRHAAIEGLEVTFKGGQVGYDDFFGTVRSGKRSEAFVGAAR